MPDDDLQTGGAFLFLSGADMDPTAVRATYPGARFVARARLTPADGDGAGGSSEIWGILLQVPAADPGVVQQVITDDGRPFRAVPAGEGAAAGDPAAVLAAAQYWELPPSYVRRLRERAGVVDPPADGEGS